MSKEIGVIGQIRAAAGNPVALIVGALLGGFVPVATYAVAHNEVAGFGLPLLLVLGGLSYSAKTVFVWGKQAFACSYKAAGFVLLVEGVMTLSKQAPLALAALCYLVAINAVATGCSLALRDAPKAPAKAKLKASKRERISRPVLKAVA